MVFSKAIVIGKPQLAAICADILACAGLETEFFTVISSGEINSAEVISKKLQTIARRGQSVRNQAIGKEALERKLLSEESSTLIVSAMNSWLLPAEILAKENLTAINHHGSLLPRHPGRHAQAWCIFEQDVSSGITWHFIVPQVDSGDIIMQRELPLTQDTTALSLLKMQSKAAVEAFRMFLPNLLMGDCPRVCQNGPRGKMHYSWERPNDGILNLDWTLDKISAFLRAMDYGILAYLGSPVVFANGKKYMWKKYMIEESTGESNSKSVECFSNEIRISERNKVVRLIGIKEAC